MRENPKTPDEKRDPASGAKGSHPIGTGVGAGAGAVAGAAIGTAAAPLVGTIIGGAVGAIAGGAAGHALAEAIKPEEEDAYWRENYEREPYYRQGTDFEHYAPAYRVGYLGRVKYDGRRYEEIEQELAAEYEREQLSDLAWADAGPAARAAWDRADRRVRQFTRN